MPINLANFTRPNSVSVFKFDPLNPVDVARVTALILSNVVFPVPGRVRLDTAQRWTRTLTQRVARSPVERVVTDNIRPGPVSVVVEGTLSATPLGPLASLFGSFGSLVRRDITEVEKLREIVTAKQVVVVTPSEVHLSMACEQLGEAHGDGNRIRVSLRFTEIRIVSPAALALDSLNVGASSNQAVGPATASAPAPTAVTPVSPFGV